MKHPRTIAAAALLLAACSDNPVAPVATPKSALRAGAGPSLSATGVAANLDFSTDLESLNSRVVPSLDDAAAAERISAALGSLSGHLSSGDRVAASADITLVRSELKPSLGSAADLGNIEMVLDLIESSL